MASLSDDDIEKLFSGAPQYYARSEGHFTGAPHPSVAYPWDDALEIRDLTDHVQIEDAAWSNVTAWPHITRKSSPSVAQSTSNIGATPGGDGKDQNEPKPIKKRSHFYPRCRERPSMLSIQGLEKGTVGYEAALELSVSDALQEDQYGFDTLGSRPAAVTEARNNLMDPIATAVAVQSAAKATQTGNANAIDESANGVKYVGETQILEELIKNGRRYADGSFYDPQQSKEFYHELFSHILRAPKKSRTSGQHKRSSSQGSANLDTELIPQIEALLDVLATPNVWIDFSHVEWRLRLGQVLWASSPHDNVDSGARSPKEDSPSQSASARPATCDERYTERYWLLLQILLATELLLRLDAITDGDEYGLEYVHPSEVHRFEKVANPSVRWSLILARAWLENIEVIRIDEDEESAAREARSQLDKTKEKLQSAASPKRSDSSTPKKKESSLRHTVGWITTLTRKLSLIEGRLYTSKEPEKKYVYAMKAKNAPRQYRGIAHFAQELKWPNDLVDVMSQRALDAHVQEPLNTKITSTPGGGANTKPQLEFSRRLLRRRKVVAGLHPGGWLSRSYLSGLMLPGDGLCNLLMSTLLEGDDDALKTLGSVAHLGSGFVYRGKSFWSTACVVGRVLSAGAGAAECMGWVSSDVLPQTDSEGWVNIDADDVANDMKLINRRARIWGKSAIERESHVLGDADRESVLPADFVIPYEAVYKQVPPKHTQVELRRFALYSPSDPKRTAKKSEDDSITPAARKDGDDTMDQAEPRLAEISFSVASEGYPEKTVTCSLAYDAYFTTAHPCVPSQRVKVVKSPSSPTIQQIDVSGGGSPGRSNTVHATGHPLHKYYKYASIHLTTLIENPDKSLEQLLKEFVACTNRAAPSGSQPSNIDTTVLVIDCITGFSPQPAAHEMPMSPITDKRPVSFYDNASISSFPPLTKEISPIAALPASSAPAPASTASPKSITTPTLLTQPKTSPPAANQMHHETRRRRFGSDMEILVRALCAERGWNALISRRRRGCLACAIRETGALNWRVIIRVD